MSEKATLTVRTDAVLKKQFAVLCDAIGIPVSMAVNAMIKQAVRKQEIKISALDVNGFTPSEAKELLRRVKEFEAEQARMKAMNFTENALDEADYYAENDSRRLNHEEVFAGLRAKINA